MKNTFIEVYNDLATLINPANPKKLFESEPPAIANPIDVGAEKLLTPYLNDFLKDYPPLEVEYLIQTLNEHLNNCLDLRSKGQELEVKVYTEIAEQKLQLTVLQSMKKQLSIASNNEPQLLANTINTKYNPSTNTITGETSNYWKDVLQEQLSQIGSKIQDSQARLDRMQADDGSGYNYFKRFEFLKEIFDKDLTEAYRRARSAAVGLQMLYGINIPVDPISDVGYLNTLVNWARNVTYELEKKFFNIREITVAIALKELIPGINNDGDFINALVTGTQFTIAEDYFYQHHQQLKNPRLRGIDVHLWTSTDAHDMLWDNFFRIYMKAPIQDIKYDNQTVSSYQAEIYIPMATYPFNAPEARDVPNQREVQNLKPDGTWSISIESKSILGVNTNGTYKRPDGTPAGWNLIQNLIIRMRIAYDRN